MADSDESPPKLGGRPVEARPRDHALSPALMARVFHQPALVYFNAVAEHLSVREAARRLNVASSAVTRQVASLEDALGMELFQREGRRLKLSPAGEILFHHARRLTAPLEAALSELDMLRGLKIGSVRIATVESVGLSAMPALIADFAQRYPGIHLDVSVGSSADVIARTAEGLVDVGFSFITGPSRGIEVAVRRDIRLGAVMRPDHPLADVPHLTLAACLEHPTAVAKPGISIREVIEPFLQRINLARRPLVEVDSIGMLVELALIGRHASLMTPIGAQNEINAGTLVFRQLEDPDIPANRFGLIVRAGGHLHFAPAVFYDCAKRHFEEINLPGSIG